MKTRLHLTIAILSVAAAAPCLAQDERPREQPFYKLDFVVKEVEGAKTINSRSYSSIVSPSDRGSIRTGNRVPTPTAGGSGIGGFYYIDVGINLDFNVTRELSERIVLNVSVDISSNVASETPALPPVVRQNKWTSTVVVPLRKATMIFASDDPSSKRQLQVELTAAPVK